MLGKLIKYEFKATGRSMLPIFLVLLALAIVNRISWALGGVKDGVVMDSKAGLFSAISIILYTAVFIASGVITLVVMIQRFYKNLLRDEGYLMNTLPVTPSMNIGAKLIASLIWIAISSVITLVSISILAYDSNFFSDVGRVLTEINDAGFKEAGVWFYILMLEALITLILLASMAILIIYLSLVIGHLADNHKLLCSFGAFIGINIIFNIVSVIISSSGITFFEGKIQSSLLDGQIFMMVLNGMLMGFSAIFFYLSSYLMKNKLNVE